jgi:hypothetical protein
MITGGCCAGGRVSAAHDARDNGWISEAAMSVHDHSRWGPTDQIGAGNLLHVFDDGGVSLIRRDELIHPMRKRMGPGRSDLEPIARRQRCQLTAQLDHLLPRPGVAAFRPM